MSDTGIEMVDERDDLEEQGPAGLRKHARELEKQLKAVRESDAAKGAKLAAYERRDAFEAAVKEAGVEGLTLQDVADLQDITPTALKVLAKERDDARTARLAEQAKDLGFASVDEFQQFVAARKAEQEQHTKDLAAVGAAAAAGGAAPVVASPDEVAMKRWTEVRKNGMPEDDALGEYVVALANAGASKT